MGGGAVSHAQSQAQAKENNKACKAGHQSTKAGAVGLLIPVVRKAVIGHVESPFTLRADNLSHFRGFPIGLSQRECRACFKAWNRSTLPAFCGVGTARKRSGRVAGR